MLMNNDVVRKRRQVVGFWKWVRIKAGESDGMDCGSDGARPRFGLRCPKLQGSGQVSAIGFQRGLAAETLKRLPIF
jgi:hypothetical protein